MAATNRLFVDLVSGVIDTTIDSDDTTLSSAALAELPVVADPDYVALTLDPEEEDGAGEIVWVTAHSSGATTATILRAQEGTAARGHLSGTKFVAPLTKAAIEGLYTRIEDAETNLTNLINGAVSDLNSAEQELENAETTLLNAAAAVNDVMPIGSILMWPAVAPPNGWLICNGDAVSRTTYSDLFGVIGTTFGGGDGSTTFNLPDYRQRYPMGVASSGPGDQVGERFGSIDHVHTGPSHVHTGPSHVHSNSNTGTSGSHNHTGGNTAPSSEYNTGSTNLAHTHSGPSHAHSFSDSFTTSGESVSQVVAAGSGQSVADNHTHTGSVSGTTGTSGTGATGSSLGSHLHTIGSHIHGGGNTSTDGSHVHGVGDTDAAGTGNTGAAGTGNTGSANPPTLAIYFIIRTGV